MADGNLAFDKLSLDDESDEPNESNKAKTTNDQLLEQVKMLLEEKRVRDALVNKLQEEKEQLQEEKEKAQEEKEQLQEEKEKAQEEKEKAQGEKEQAQEEAKKERENFRMLALMTASENTWVSSNFVSRKWTTQQGQSSRSVSSATRRPLRKPDAGCKIIENLTEVMKGFDQLEDTKLYDLVYSQVKADLVTKETSRPVIGDRENSKVHMHGFIDTIMTVIDRTLEANNRSVNKRFHEHQATGSTGKRPDWVFTRPNEQAHSFINTLFYLEAKAVGTLRSSRKRFKEQSEGTVRISEDKSTDSVPSSEDKSTDSVPSSEDKSTAISPQQKLAEGLFQCIRRVAERHERNGRRTTHGFGVVCNGNQLQILRVNFAHHQIDGLYPVYATSILPLLTPMTVLGAINEKVESQMVADSEDATCPEGLRYLIDLLVNHELEQFGLPSTPLPDVVEKSYTSAVLLGTGGFGDVWKVQNKNGLELACKCIRNSKLFSLQVEALCLQKLQDFVPYVPRLVETILDDSDNVVALIMSPIGLSLKDWVVTQPGLDLAQFAAQVFNELFRTITAIHKKGYIHEDIRPSNVIVSNRDGSSSSVHQVVLIDWGLAASPDEELRHNFGQPEYMCDDRLHRLLTCDKPSWNPHPCHDLQALGLTYFSIKNNFKPFSIDVSKGKGCVAARRQLIDAAVNSVTDAIIRSKLEVCFPPAPPLEQETEMDS